MRVTAASSGWDGAVATDRWGAYWRVSCHRAGVLPAPAEPPDGQSVHRLLMPWETAAVAAPPPPRASWVLGRSARWQGPRAPGASEDPLRDEAITARNLLAAGRGGLGALAVLLLAAGRIVQRIRLEPTHPWLVQLTACTGPTRSAVWVVAGPDAAQLATREVAEALRAGRPPVPSGARLLDVRDDRR
ncbi:hypothetical protein [Modestobacter italicus]|uniref:hypothetical protein n=1 Tax=Modestobacter italicus (strain DSM 44449 / CECT 9708 / BC 501) TaxID=2732864 RepID=UPI001C958BB5|nr:hypothetical protein [Modestobacter italicus]